MRKFASLLAVVAILLTILPVSAKGGDATTGNGKGAGTNSAYIVQMSEMPVVAYEGGIQGLKPTAPRKGQKINPLGADVVKYVGYLNGKHLGALKTVGAEAKKIYDYVYTFNGFAANLTEAEAAALRRAPGVLAVNKDQLMKLDTATTPYFLGLADASGNPTGLWQELMSKGGPGEGVVVGIVDSGIWPENPSFSDRTAENPNGKPGKLGFKQIPGWNGKCTPGEQFPASKCNQKLIAAQYYYSGWGNAAEVKTLFPEEYISARDADGHGSHTASTAAGNWGVQPDLAGVTIGKISGMAPRARIAAYKVCWGSDAGGCFGSDSVAAIDQAVADGVDVINFSISGTSTNFMDAVEIAFLFAARAGVFVAASAGNSGPTAATVAHPSPWLTTVGASTHSRDFPAILKLGDGTEIAGKSISSVGVPSSPVVLADNAVLAPATTAEALLCYPGSLDPAVVTGKIVVCDRGVIARTDKSLAVQMAGGIGMIMTNTSVNSVNADLHFVPSIHVSHLDRPAIRTYAATAGATAQIIPGTPTINAPAPFMASFSSRGPLRASIDLLKPDLTAPGEDILAAVSPVPLGRNFDFLSGTSMSSPHVAGLAALLKHKYPTWSPAAIKSALMTSGYDVLGVSPNGPTPFNQGAGHVAPTKAGDPGLVFDAGWNDYLAFLCGAVPGAVNPASCTALAGLGYGTDSSDLNLASIQIGDLVGAQTVKRTVTNVSKTAATYSASASGPVGINVTVTPNNFTLNPGGKQVLAIEFATTPAALNGYQFGNLTLSGGPNPVRIPLVIRTAPIAVPASALGSGVSGSTTFNVKVGGTTYTPSMVGLAEATKTAGTVADDPTDNFVVGGPGITVHTFIIPAGTTYARFSLFDEYTDGADDIDLYVYRGATQVGGSGSGTSAEEVNLVNPPADTYTVYVHGWQTDGPDANYTLFSWIVGSTDAGNATVTGPGSVVPGGIYPVTVNWSGLSAGTKYLGYVLHTPTAARTVVRVDTDVAATVGAANVQATGMDAPLDGSLFDPTFLPSVGN